MSSVGPIPALSGNYLHVRDIPPGRRLLTLSGRRGVDAAGIAPAGAEAAG